MKWLLSVLGSRWFWGLVGVVLLSLLIWFFAPYVAFGGVRPLAGVLARVIAIGVIALVWAVVMFLRYWRNRRANERLGAEILGTAESEADAAGEELRRQFEEAISFLRGSKRGGNLYQLPWYVIIGPPGSGKTTALVNSGLTFPLRQEFGQEALRGVGGTRNCDWWFTDEAVLLDTAGRYLSQDTDASSDHAEWSRFLELLVRYRKRRPINGVIVTLSASDLLNQSAEARDGHIMAVRRRLNELQQHLRIQFPVYFMLTKCDLVAGFAEFFDDFGHEARAQVWGVTLPEPGKSGGRPSEVFRREYPGLVGRLNERVLARLDQEREPQRRALLFGFPGQMASLEDRLADFIEAAFESSRFDQPVLLRGVYFTSGTQEGTPIDRMMGTLSQTFGLDAEMTPNVAGGQGRGYFLQRLFKEVIFPESGLAGVNWRLEVGRAVAQNAAYILLLGATVLLVAGWYTSYRYNKDYLADVARTLEVHREMATMPVPASAGFSEILPRLDALREVAAVATRYKGDTPLLMGLGLFRGDAVGAAALAAYHQGLLHLLLPRIVQDLERRIRSGADQPKRLYRNLKAYLMLAHPEHLNREQLMAIVGGNLRRRIASGPAVGKALALHFEALLAREEPPDIGQPDRQLVARARSTLNQISVPVLMLSRLETIYDRDHPAALRLDLVAGLGSEQIFRRASGVPLSKPLPALYTKAGFKEITGGIGSNMIDRFLQESWVLGAENLPSGPTAEFRLAAQFLRYYEDQYIAFWEHILADLEIAPLLSVERATRVLATLSGPASPLTQLLTTIDHQTHFPPPKGTAAGRTAAQKLSAGGALGLAGTAVETVSELRPGARISEHFQSLHRIVAGTGSGSAPLDRLVALLGRLYAQLESLGNGLGGRDALTVLSRSSGRDALHRLRLKAKRLPPPFGEWLGQLAGGGRQVALRNLRAELNTRYRNHVLPACRRIVQGRYPFYPNSNRGVPLSDFARLFGPGGILQTFFNEHLAPLVDTSGRHWRWKRAGLGIPDSVLRPFQRARTIRQIFFAGGSGPVVRFELTPHYLDGRVRRFTLTVDGQSLVYRHGPPLSTSMQWPGPDNGLVIAEFQTRAGLRPNVRFEGPWAWFRMLQSAALSAESAVSYLVSFTADGYTARVRVQFDTTRNPLNLRDWTAFRCPGRL